MLGRPLGLTITVCETQDQCAANEGKVCVQYLGTYEYAEEGLRLFCAPGATGKYLRLRQNASLADQPNYGFVLCEVYANGI